MKSGTRMKLLGLASVALLLAACERPSDISRGEQLAIDAGCVQCHGTNGRGTGPTFPNLNGQRANYMFDQLQRYRSGVRVDPVMNVQAAELTDREIDLLSRWYAAQ